MFCLRQAEGKITSRFAMSQRQRTIKDDFEKKVQHEAQMSAKRRKCQDRSVQFQYFIKHAINIFLQFPLAQYFYCRSLA